MVGCEAMNHDSDKWYFAYGANMDPDVFIVRRRMRPTARDRAVLDGYKLVFDHPGISFLLINGNEIPGKKRCDRRSDYWKR